MDKRRIIDIRKLNDIERVKNDYNSFSKEELNKIDDYIITANQQIEFMFDEINSILRMNK